MVGTTDTPTIVAIGTAVLRVRPSFSIMRGNLVRKTLAVNGRGLAHLATYQKGPMKPQVWRTKLTRPPMAAASLG